ncbi:MAG: hypothetical protein PHY48_15530, partial [Candidatus Cloacimonetes bacterium]|nr:hypothetical protein [Candidatus Cloacimonadota bacterium]
MNDTANQKTIITSISDDPVNALILRGRPLMQRNPDNTQTTYEYDLDQVNGELIITTYSSTTDRPQGIAGKSTYTIEYIDANYGRTIALEKYLYNGEEADDVLLEFEHSYYNSDDRLISTEYSDGTFNSSLWNCCSITNTIARDGIVIAYNEWPSNPADSEVVYLSQGQLPGADGNHPAHYTHTDAIGREIESTSYVADPQFGYHFGYAEQVTKTAYPFGTDNFSVITDPLGICTTNITTWKAATNITVTSRAGITTTDIAIAGGARITTTEWTDSVSGISYKQETKTESEIQPNGGKKTTSYVKYDDGEWLAQSETVNDLLGWTVTSSRVGTGGAMLVTSNVYNSAGLLVRTISQNGASTVFDYNELGKRIVTISVAAGQTLDFNPQSFTLAGVIALDKYNINLTTENTENTEGEWWNCATSVVYKPGENALTSSVYRTQLTGLTLQNNSCSISIDADENKIINSESVYPANATKVAKSLDIAFNATNVSYYVAGHETCSSNSLGGVTEYLYDGFARRVKTTNYANGRELKSVVTYHDDGSMATVGEVTASGTNSTSYSVLQTVAGKPSAHKITVTDAKGNQTINYYSGNGQLYRSEGATYPTETAFDAAGHMVE